MSITSASSKISCDKGSSLTLQSNWRMGNTHSMSHPPFFVSEPNLTTSDKKFGRAGGKVYSVKSLRLFSREFREFREIKEVKGY